MEQPILWRAPEHAELNKTTDQFIALTIVSVVAATIAFFFHNFFFGVLVLVAALTLILLAHKTPQMVPVSLTAQELIFGPLRLPMERMESFWFEQKEKSSFLHIKTKNVTRPFVSIVIPHFLTSQVRDFLSRAGVKEERFNDRATDRVASLLGF